MQFTPNDLGHINDIISKCRKPGCCFHWEAQSGEFSCELSAKELNTKMQSRLLKCQWKTGKGGGQVVNYHCSSKIGKGLIVLICPLHADNMAGTMRERRGCSASLLLENRE